MKLQPGDRVTAKYRGNGVVVAPSDHDYTKSHFDDDVRVTWDSGASTWVQPSMLRLLGGREERK